ncbi:MAG: glycosyltransferase [Eubacteriales bacterium]|nr:glycosyltransferase [Eubacteriales bacterium]
MKKRVLIVTESISYGGLNLVSVNLQQHLDKEKFDCTFCVRRSQKGELEHEITEQGIKVIHVPDSELNYLKSYLFYKKTMKDGNYDIVHCHLPFISGIVLLAAKQAGVKNRIAHAHFSQPYTDTAIYSKKKQIVADVYRKIMRLFLKVFCTVKLACSYDSGCFLYGRREFEKNGIILNNGIDTESFAFNKDIRKSVRNELNINEKAVVFGHIGQLYSVKNQTYVIDVFNEFHKNNGNSYLLVIGDGTDREKLENKVCSLGLEKSVLFLGLRNDANRLYQAMDIFVFPSVHEGFPVTLVEAQASKLPCIVSDTITKDTKLNRNIEYMSVDLPAEKWAEKIENMLTADRETVDNSNVIKQYDINNIAKELENIYLR